MNLATIIIALIWGTLSGYLILRTLDSLLAIVFCLHGLLMTRWKRLANKATPGQIKYGTILHQLFRVTLCGMVCGFLLESGNNLVQQKFHFNYQGFSGLLWVVVAAIVTIFLLRTSWRRLIVAWKITHEFDYAERRQRTSLLKG